MPLDAPVTTTTLSRFSIRGTLLRCRILLRIQWSGKVIRNLHTHRLGLTVSSAAGYTGNMTRSPKLSFNVTLTCLFAALCCAGAFLSIPLPLSPVPITLSNFFAVLAGLLLGPAWGAGAAALYVAIGALGFPVFAGGTGGLAHIVGPTGGYLVGYIAAAALAGLISGGTTAPRRRIRVALASFIGFGLILALGALGLLLLSGLAAAKAFAVGVVPFLPGDTAKIVLAAALTLALGPFLDELRGGTKSRG